ncbi:MAG TPA: hypothetical protein VEL74_24330 [Thermoanaerobaculia bacterium]|nr:hypothetical protein [Thermoanaerobaculia bacterium]
MSAASPEIQPAERELLVRWYAGLLGGLLPILLLGFLYSALADRLEFVGWALGLGVVWVIALRHGLGAGWPRPRLWGTLALLLALGLGGFSAIERRHHEILDLGFRAVFPNAYHPVATRPGTAAALAGLLALTGGAALAIHGIRQRRAR